MAIIYTYPKLTNPQGNELIVVSDVNNRNSTRLITIASIASLVPSGGGCSTAITGIVDNLGAPLYTALACSEMELVSTDGSVDIASTATGIDLTVDSAFDLDCATPTELGGVKISSSFGLEVIPSPVTSNYDTYPIETNINPQDPNECTAIVRIPEIVSLECATPTTIGGVKALENTTVTVMPEVAEEGSYYPIEVVKAQGAASQDECRAIVKVPAGEGEGCSDVFKTITNAGGTFSFDASGCNDTLTLGSTGGTITITSVAQGSVNFEVDTPLDCATTAVIGGVKVATDDTVIDPVLDIQGDPYPLEVNTSCQAFVRVPTGGGGGGEQAWSPLSIYEANQGVANDLGVMVQSVAEATIPEMNKVDFFITNLPASAPGDVGRFDIYSGSLQSGGTWLGGGSSSGSGVAGIQTITLPNPVNIIAGNKYVIYWRLVGNNFEAAGIKAGALVDANLAVATGVPGGTAVPDADLATEIAALQMNADEPEALLRIAHTMYKA